MHAAIAGLLTGLSLIVAIGAQNAYVLRLGLSRSHVGPAVAICIGADAILIAAGVGGLGRVIHAAPALLEIFRWFGVAYLALYGIRSFMRARHADVLRASGEADPTLGTVIRATLAFTFLNPHVYLDTVVLLGSVANTFGSSRWFFALGAATGSALWFSSLGVGARALAPVMSRPRTWVVLEIVIGVIMVFVALNLAMTRLSP